MLSQVPIRKEKKIQQWEILELQGSLESNQPFDSKSLGSLALLDPKVRFYLHSINV